jgi:hypothetical protein
MFYLFSDPNMSQSPICIHFTATNLLSGLIHSNLFWQGVNFTSWGVNEEGLFLMSINQDVFAVYHNSYSYAYMY